VVTLYETKGNQCHAARALGVHRNTLARQLKELGIDIAEIRELFRSYQRSLKHDRRQPVPIRKAA
jgi:DNA-binding PucR family transcriptional regulator